MLRLMAMVGLALLPQVLRDRHTVGNIVVPTGTAANEGIVRGIILPPGQFKWVIYNQLGATMNATNTAKYRTYNRQVV